MGQAQRLWSSSLVPSTDVEYASATQTRLCRDLVMRPPRLPKPNDLHAPHFIKGVVNLRSVIVPIVDLRLKLACEAEYTDFTVVIAPNARSRAIGAVVDSAYDSLALGAASIKPVPEMNGSVDPACANAMAARPGAHASTARAVPGAMKDGATWMSPLRECSSALVRALQLFARRG